MKGPIGRRPNADAVVKLLFALSGNVCAFSDPERGLGCEQRLADPSWDSVQAVICHIHGWSPGGPRYIEMPDDERNSAENLILLCPNHSHFIDRVKPDDYPAEVLKAMKARHEDRHGSSGWKPTEAELNAFAAAAIALTDALLTARPSGGGVEGSAKINRVALAGDAGMSGSAGIVRPPVGRVGTAFERNMTETISASDSVSVKKQSAPSEAELDQE